MPTDLVVIMSIWTSVRPSYEDFIDVAYSLHGDQIRFAFNDQTMQIDLEEAKKLAKKINIAVVMAENS
jgi:hypothetical protein